MNGGSLISRSYLADVPSINTQLIWLVFTGDTMCKPCSLKKKRETNTELYVSELDSIFRSFRILEDSQDYPDNSN